MNRATRGDPVFVINPERSLDRRAQMKAHLDAHRVPFTIVDAIDGDARPFYSWTFQRNLLPGEVGCYLSHKKAARLIADSDCDFACVLEDDAALEPAAIPFLR